MGASHEHRFSESRRGVMLASIKSEKKKEVSKLSTASWKKRTPPIYREKMKSRL